MQFLQEKCSISAEYVLKQLKKTFSRKKASPLLIRPGVPRKYPSEPHPKITFFSTDKIKGNIFQIWKWPEIVRWNKFFKKIN